MANLGDIEVGGSVNRSSSLDFDFSRSSGDGFSMNKVGGIISGIAGLFDAFSSRKAGQAEAENVMSTAIFNARLAGFRGNVARENTLSAIRAREAEGRRVSGEQRVAVAKSGVTTAGSPGLVMTEADISAANEVAAIKYAGALREIEQKFIAESEIAAATSRAGAIKSATKTDFIGNVIGAYTAFRLGAG